MSKDVLNLTIGRATNDQLEATVAVWWKDEGDAGPIYLQVSGEQPSGDNPMPRGDLVPLNRGEAEWFEFGVAEELGRVLDVPVVLS
jgi:hypothetical protein